MQTAFSTTRVLEAAGGWPRPDAAGGPPIPSPRRFAKRAANQIIDIVPWNFRRTPIGE
jgi:hypothetical protein